MAEGWKSLGEHGRRNLIGLNTLLTEIWALTMQLVEAQKEVRTIIEKSLVVLEKSLNHCE